MREVSIRGDSIRLGQLLKLAGVTGSGAEVKAFLQAEQVEVNGVPEDRRGRQLHPGDVIAAAGELLQVAGEPPRGASMSGESPGPAPGTT